MYQLLANNTVLAASNDLKLLTNIGKKQSQQDPDNQYTIVKASENGAREQVAHV